MIVVTHFFDTATDIGLLYEWGVLYKKQQRAHKEGKKFYENVDMGFFFFFSLAVILYYRIGSAVHVHKLTKSFQSAIMQFIFDYYILRLLYVNLVKMHKYKPMEMVKIIRGMEGYYVK